ncbi:putative Galactoside 2-alpha-L-fucosyltransferase 1 [Hypsibius exemplaris]|uniref:L-Fucosyltransferase n=1 Tax=Hypsibius exemplaris TaxID=2072580 RepID=A0A1W0X8T4_HYPEX|nr:putative Galactoside 2-alpha-L-fucosyltransferase 1 [Hypsibius exemplaris]
MRERFCASMRPNDDLLFGIAVIVLGFLFISINLERAIPAETTRASILQSRSSTAVHIQRASISPLDDDIPVVTHSFFKAGTGNTLFFIASIIGIARSNGRRPVLSKDLSLLKTMNIDLPIINASSLESFKRIQDASVGVYHKKYRNLTALVGSSNVYFAGYLQSYKYFHHCKEEILRQFQFRKSVTDEALELIQNAAEGRAVTLVGVHVRRGDLLKNSRTRGLHRTAPQEYFLTAMARIRSKLPGPLLFVVISDSLEWCRTVFLDEDVRFVRGSVAAVDMKVLASMEHLIISVGTFGWWSAYLSAAKSVTYYRHWYNKDMESGRRFRPKDFFPPEWIADEKELIIRQS